MDRNPQFKTKPLYPPSNKDNLGDLLNASANRVKKTKVDVKSENAARFREMFDKGEVPEGAGGVPGDRGALGAIAEKEQERQKILARSSLTQNCRISIS